MDDIDYNIENIYHAAEMLPFERKTLFNWMINIIKPQHNILETGTGTGGSTYYLSRGLKKINEALEVFTCDPSRSPSQAFLQEHKNVAFFNFYSEYLIDYIVKSNIKISYMFFDGPEDPNVALNDFKKMEEYIDKDCYFSMHDWEIEPRKYDNAISTKALYLRPYIESSNRWEKIEVLDGLNNNNSVGLCLYKFLG